MKKLCVLFFLVLLSISQSFGALRWGSDAAVILDFNGNPVPSSSEELSPFTPLDPTVGAFAQLIRILTGSTPFEFVNSGSGISPGNEQVVGTMYSGLYDDLLVTAGAFPRSTDGTFLNGSEFNGFYYVRVFDAPQATLEAYDLGNAAPIPAGAQYYYQSSVYEYTHNPLVESIFDFGPGQTTLAVVTEPGTLALLGVGMLGLAARRRMIG